MWVVVVVGVAAGVRVELVDDGGAQLQEALLGDGLLHPQLVLGQQRPRRQALQAQTQHQFSVKTTKIMCFLFLSSPNFSFKIMCFFSTLDRGFRSSKQLKL